jgi:hypothetical protein
MLVPAREARGASGRTHDWVFGEGVRRYVEPIERRRYNVQALEGVDLIAYPLRASVEVRGANLRVKVDNADARGLADAWLVFAGHTYALGDIDPGVRIERDFAMPAQAAERGEAFWRRVPKPPAGVASHLTQPAQVLLERRARAAGEQGYPRAGHALLLAYANGPLEARGASRDWPRHERALVAYELEALARPTDAGPARLGELQHPGPSGTANAPAAESLFELPRDS